jgi:hypothetical protein
MTKVTQLAAVAMLAGAVALIASTLIARAAEFEDSPDAKPTVAFRAWQRAWQCSDIRVTETVTKAGIVNYDLAGTIWGGSQFVLDIQRGTMWFNRRPCVFLGSTP